MNKNQQKSNSMHVCPWWLAYTFDNPLRRMIDPVDKAIGKWVRPGMTVLDFGCGLGHYTIGAAYLVGDKGTVIAADFQQKMLDLTAKRAAKSSVENIVKTHKCGADQIGYSGKVDFAIAGNVMHETPNRSKTFQEIFSILVPGGGLLFTEPRYHVKTDIFATELKEAQNAGFILEEFLSSFRAHRAFLQKPKEQ